MKKFIKITVLILSGFSFFVFSALIYGINFIPDTYGSDSLSVSVNGLFYTKPKTNGIAVSTGSAKTATSDLMFLNIFPVKEVTVKKSERRYVAIGGELIGIILESEGVIVAGTEAFECEGKKVSPAENSGITAGDIIVEANGVRLNNKSEFTDIIKNSDGNSISVKIKRNGEVFEKILTPMLSDSSLTFRAGIWIKDSLGGIGTLTYMDLANGTLASLGHGIYDGITNSTVEISGGQITLANTTGVEKGIVGKAGQLCGTATQTILGNVSENNDKGIYGNLSYACSPDNLYPVAEPCEVHTGEAQIVCTVTNGEKEFYDIEIEKISNSYSGKDITLKVTDTDLLSITGGIVQGMSGSPIIQDGMFVGAVTHVFLNNPERGYGIYATEMLELSDSISTINSDAA